VSEPHPFARHLRRAGVLPDAVVAALDAGAVDRALAAGALPDVPPGTLRAVAEAWGDSRAIAEVDPEVVGAATLPAGVRALGAPVDRARLVVLEGAVRRAVEGGSVVGRPSRAGHPGLAAYAAHVDHVEFLAGISAHRWLALERAEREGVLRREWRWAEDLGAPAWALALLPRAVAETVHRRARADATWAAAGVLIGLLTAPPRRVAVVAAARSGGRLGVAVRAPDGAVPWQRTGALEDAAALVGAALAGRPGAPVALPAGLEVASLGLPRGVDTVIVHGAALHEAARSFRAPHTVALALAVAERAQEPRAAWGRLDPVSLGLVEYQQDLDPAYVRLVLGLARAEAEGRRARVEVPRQVGAAALATRLEDLKPGMLLPGTVTQIAPFGAFVDVGVGRDGLVHVSELSDERVQSPTDVVQIGQKVLARVFEVDRARGRISLSLRRGSSGPRGRDAARKQALDALGKLFK
jgi:predicted RNA-binding protein with RPS1 domain